MQIKQPELLNPREKHWSKRQLPLFEARIAVIPRGLVAARILAFQEAPGKTWSTNRVIPREKLLKSEALEAPPFVERKLNYKNPRNTCEQLSSVIQTPCPFRHQSSRLAANNPNPEEGDEEREQPNGLFEDDMADSVADEASEKLYGATTHQLQCGTNAKGGPEIEEAPRFCPNKLDRGVRSPEAKRSYLNMPPTKTPSMEGLVGKSSFPLESSQPNPSTLSEAGNESKKYRFWRGGNQKPIPPNSLETTRASGSHVTTQPGQYSNLWSAQSQQALTLGPLDPSILEIQDAIELHYLSPRQVTCLTTGESVPSGHRNVARTLSLNEAKPLESTIPTRTVRHSLSTSLMRSPSQPSGSKSMLVRWSWWKFGDRKQGAEEEITGNSQVDSMNSAIESEPLIPLEIFPTQPNGYDEGTIGQVHEEEPDCANDPNCTSQISNKKHESIMGCTCSAGEEIVSPKGNESQSRSCVEFPIASTPPELDLRPSPRLCTSPSFATTTLSQEGSPSAASTIRLQPDQPMKWRKRRRSFQRIRLSVNLDMTDLVLKARIEKKGKGKVV